MCGAAAVAINQGWIEGSSSAKDGGATWWIMDTLAGTESRRHDLEGRNWAAATGWVGHGQKISRFGLTDKNRVLSFVLGRKVELKTHMVFSDGEKKVCLKIF
ncbi:hypothetical protein OROMI_026137 [Orobanche minor]